MLFKGMSLISDHHGVQVSVSNLADVADANDRPVSSRLKCGFLSLLFGMSLRTFIHWDQDTH